ncbi:MAG: tetratricopeptide repeat protein, partial [Bacteroidota bacterium]
MSMFDFGPDPFEDSHSKDLRDLIAAYEAQDGLVYFDSETLEDIATYYFELGEFGQALGVIDRLLEMYPFSSDAWMRRGILLNNLTRHEEALDAYTQA